MAAVSYSADINNETPAAENEQPRSSSRLILWLVVAGLGILLLLLLQISMAIKNDNAALEDQIAAIEATLTSTPKPQPTNQALREQLIQLQAQAKALENVKPTLVAGHTDWLTILQAIGSFDPTQIILNGIAQTDIQLVVTGQSVDENTVTSYAQMLTDSKLFTRVIVQSIILRNSTASSKGLADFTISLELGSPQQAAH